MAKNNILYSIAISSTGQLINANDAQKGIDYICPLCKQPFILRKGKQKRPHFAHKNLSPNCTPETALHYSFKNLLAKKIQEHVEDNKPLEIKWKCSKCHDYHSGNLLKKAVQVKVEHDLGVCRPDIALLDTNDRTVAVIEVIVSHAPEPTASDFYKKNNITVVSYILKTDEDISRLENPILEPDSVDLCTNPRCPKCRLTMAKRRLLIVDAKCRECSAPMKLASLASEIRGFIGGEFMKSELDLATKQGCLLKTKFIRGTNYKYSSNTCTKCHHSMDSISDLMCDINYFRDDSSKEFVNFYCPGCTNELY